jgi:hypothetical protein
MSHVVKKAGPCTGAGLILFLQPVTASAVTNTLMLRRN